MSEPSQQPQRDPDSDDEISLLELVNVLLRRWKLVLGLPVGAAAASPEVLASVA